MIIDMPKCSDIRSLKALWREAFSDTDEYINTFFDTAFSVERCMTVKEDGCLLAALYWLDCSLDGGRVAYIYAVATAKAERGRGICRKLMEYTHSHLISHGYAAAMLVPGSDGLFEFYEKLGYATATYISEISVAAIDEPVELFEISAEEYGMRRRALLPPGGVLQEKESLDLLASVAALYCGDGFILAVRKGEDSLILAELLGDTGAASKITRTLGYSRARIRIPGRERRFSMIYRLCDKHISPSYFGLAFD